MGVSAPGAYDCEFHLCLSLSILAAAWLEAGWADTFAGRSHRYAPAAAANRLALATIFQTTREYTSGPYPVPGCHCEANITDLRTSPCISSFVETPIWRSSFASRWEWPQNQSIPIGFYNNFCVIYYPL